MSLFPLFYAGNIGYFRQLALAEHVEFEVQENYPKQTYRNRMEILGPNGIHRLSIPIRKTGQRMSTGEARISFDETWQKDHWKGIEAAYRRSPYFEYYEDRFKPLFFAKPERLMDYSLPITALILDLLDVAQAYTFTTSYTDPIEVSGKDFRAINFQSPEFISQEKYIQVFNDRHPFTPNLSILDALFNLGPSAKELLH